MKQTDSVHTRAVAFTDGASRGNPGPGGWGVVFVLPSGSGEPSVVELGGREDSTTNNRMELTAAIETLKYLDSAVRDESSAITIRTDSQYLINGITKWVPGWIKNNWVTKGKTPVLNQDLWKVLHELYVKHSPDFEYVSGHTGIAGNERADQIATLLADKAECTLEHTSLTSYPIDLFGGTTEGSTPKKSSTPTSGKAYSYVSKVHGKIQTHQSWSECKERVEGKNALFRKALSKNHESDIIAEFEADVSRGK